MSEAEGLRAQLVTEAGAGWVGGQEQVPIEGRSDPQRPQPCGQAPPTRPCSARGVARPSSSGSVHGRRKGHAGRAVGGDHEQVDFAGGVPKRQVSWRVVIHTKGQVEGSGGSRHHQADQEQVLGVRASCASEDEEGQAVPHPGPGQTPGLRTGARMADTMGEGYRWQEAVASPR